MSETFFVGILGTYMISIALGITMGGLLGFCILLLRHRRSKAYSLHSD